MIKILWMAKLANLTGLRLPAGQSSVINKSLKDHGHLHERISEVRTVHHHFRESIGEILVERLWLNIIWLGVGIMSVFSSVVHWFVCVEQG